MGRSRSRSPSSSSYSSSSDSEEEREREERRRARHNEERREKREAKRLKREADRKATEALREAGSIGWRIKDMINDYGGDEDDEHDDDDDDASIVTICGVRPDGSDVTDCTDWPRLEQYLRNYFDVHESNRKVAVRFKYFCGEQELPSLQGRASEPSSLANIWAQLAAALKREDMRPAERRIDAELIALATPVKRKRPKKPETERSKAERDLFGKLVTAVYGLSPGHFAEGTWTEEASEIMRRELKMLQKFLTMQESDACHLHAC
jgi:hypothetical protein